MLVDTNVILESYRTASWPALTGGLRIQTVEDCVTETQTGFQLRRSEQMIDSSQLELTRFGGHLQSRERRCLHDLETMSGQGRVP